MARSCLISGISNVVQASVPIRQGCLALSVAILTMGCAETNIQAIERLRSAYSVYRHGLAQAMSTLPEAGSVTAFSVPKQLYPAPVFYEDRMNEPTATAEIYYLDERRQTVSLSIRSPISSCLAWTGSHNPLHPDVWNDRGGLGEECEAALRRPWLVLLRAAESRLPERWFMEAFLIYVPTWSVAGSFPIRVYGRERPNESEPYSPTKPVPSDVLSAFHEATSCELYMRLNQLPGGRFSFDRRGCRGNFDWVALPESFTTQLAR